MPKPPPAPETPPIIFSKFNGLVNTVTAERLDPSELLSAVNIDLDDRSQAHRRRGYTLKLSGDCHSLYEGKSGTYGVVNNNLCLINPNYTTFVLKAGLNSDPSAGLAPLCYVEIGDTIYYSSATDSGKIVGGVVLPWGAQDDSGFWLSPVINPTPTLAAIKGRRYAKVPMATSMCYFNGRIYMADGNVLWATELYLYDYVDKTKNFLQFEGEITLVGQVGDGIYVGTDEGLWFLQGPTFPLKRSRVQDSPVIPGSMVDIPAELANPPQVQGDADTPIKISIAFMTTTGFCVGEDSGQTTNYTEDKFIFPELVRAAAHWHRQDGMNQYIVVADSGGTPTSTARIGDYVEAELIRAMDNVKAVGEYMLLGDQLEVGTGYLFSERATIGDTIGVTHIPAE